MGKTKIKIIGEPVEEEKHPVDTSSSPVDSSSRKKPVKKLGRQDELVERLKAELEAEAPTKEKPEEKPVVSEPATGKEAGAIRPEREVSKEKTKPQKPGKAKPRSKKYQEAVKDLDRNKVYPLNEAVELTKKLSYSKFTGALEAHINTVSTGIRGLVSLPFVSGKKLQILAFGKGAESSGADVVGTDAIIEEINKGKVNFDLIITTAEWMPKLAKVARILGPKDLMPNPKAGTITDDLKKAVAGFQAGKTEYKTEQKAPVIHLPLGKLNQPTEQLQANIKTLLQNLGKTRVKKVTLSPTMGPSVKIDLTSI